MCNKLFISILTIGFLSLSGSPIKAQIDSTEFVKPKIFLITTMGGGKFIGTLLSDNSSEIVVKTKDRGEVSIPKYEIKTMKELEESQLNKDGEYVSDPIFATRYFITTNSFPLKKGDNYICWNLFGPEYHFGVGEKFGVGVMTSWLGIPIIGTAKYSINLAENVNLGIGTLVGTASWLSPKLFGALPFGTLTFGTRKSNINFSGGYGVISAGNGTEGTALFSVAGTAGNGGKASFVFDSFILPLQSGDLLALVIPGVRIQSNDDRAFQIGFAGVFYKQVLSINWDSVPLPIPMVTWFGRL
jgi:hypothetical protein